MSWTGAMVGSARSLKQMSKNRKILHETAQTVGSFCFSLSPAKPGRGSKYHKQQKNLFKTAQQIGSFRFSLSPEVHVPEDGSIRVIVLGSLSTSTEANAGDFSKKNP
jgi:hypothetical protein